MPPFVLFKIVPPSPTAVIFVEVKAAISLSFDVIPEFNACQLEPNVEVNIVPASPVAKSRLLVDEQIGRAHV